MSFTDILEHYGSDPIASIDKNFEFVKDASLRRFLTLKQVSTSPCFTHLHAKVNEELSTIKLDARIEQLVSAYSVATEVALSSGGDDRLTLMPSKNYTTKYLSSTLPRPMVRRGSCTCTTTNLGDYLKADEVRRDIINRLINNGTSIDDITREVRSKVERLFGFEFGCDAFPSESTQSTVLFPSGSDAEYLPLMTALIMSYRLGQKLQSSSPSDSYNTSIMDNIKVFNFVTASGEVGSGTPNAAKATFFSADSPRTPDPKGYCPKNNALFRGIKDSWVSLVEFKARNESGSIAFAEEDIALSAREKLLQNKQSVVVLHLVYGSKTGLEYPSIRGMLSSDYANSPILTLSKEFQDRVVLVVDMCQLRSDLNHVKTFVDTHNAFCLVTASKFYCGPPFSGAVVFPKHYANLVESYLSSCTTFDESQCILSPDLTSFLSSHEIPVSMPNFRRFIQSHSTGTELMSSSSTAVVQDWNNAGLHLRWLVGLDYIEKCSRIPRSYAVEFIQLWVKKVSALIANRDSPYLVLLPNAEDDSNEVNSIISVAVLTTHSSPIFRNKTGKSHFVKRCTTVDEAKVFHQRMTEGEGPLTCLGQPVKLCNDFSLNLQDDNLNEADIYGPLCTVVRIAFGADMLLQLFEGCDFKKGSLSAADCTRIYNKLDSLLEIDRKVIDKMHHVAESLDKLSFKSKSESGNYIYSNAELDKIIQSLGVDSLKSDSETFTTIESAVAALSSSACSLDDAGIYYDFNAITSNIAYLLSSFSRYGSLLHCFAVKSCPVSVILRYVVRLGLGLETASIMEVKQSLRIGCPPSKIVFDSPCKTEEEIFFALKNGVNINANSFEEFDKIKAVYEQLSSAGHTSFGVIGLRINPIVGSGSIKALSTATITSKFGVPLPPLENSEAVSTYSEEWKEYGESQRRKVLNLFLENEFLTCVMCHVGSQGMPIELMVQGAKRIADLADEIDSACGSPRIAVIDIGGGLSVDYLNDVKPKFDEYADSLQSNCKNLFKEGRLVMTEFGKSIIAKTGIIVAKIEDVLHPFHGDSSRDHSIAVSHVGADLMLRTAYCPDKFSHRLSILDSSFTVKRQGSDDGQKQSSVTVVGPLCFSGDIIGDNLTLPSPQAGDWLVVQDAGANTLALFSRHCSRQSPAVFGFTSCPGVYGSAAAVSHRIEKIRSKETEDDIYQFWG